MQFAASPPLVSRAVAEVEPDRATAGETTAFVYKLRPQLEPGDRGFDSIRIETPARVLSVDPLGHINGREVELVTTIDETGFSIQIPRFEPQQTEELIEIGIIHDKTNLFGFHRDESTTLHNPRRLLSALVC